MMTLIHCFSPSDPFHEAFSFFLEYSSWLFLVTSERESEACTFYDLIVCVRPIDGIKVWKQRGTDWRPAGKLALSGD